jgi:hypothetical protein
MDKKSRFTFVVLREEEQRDNFFKVFKNKRKKLFLKINLELWF